MHNFLPQHHTYPKPPTIKTNGMYPGSGIAPGGQQGRIQAMHGGIGGANRGGYTPGASGARPQAAGYDELMKALAAAVNPTRSFV